MWIKCLTHVLDNIKLLIKSSENQNPKQKKINDCSGYFKNTIETDLLIDHLKSPLPHLILLNKKLSDHSNCPKFYEI